MIANLQKKVAFDLRFILSFNIALLVVHFVINIICIKTKRREEEHSHSQTRLDHKAR